MARGSALVLDCQRSGRVGFVYFNHSRGISGTLTRRLGRTSVHLGAEVSFLEYGEESRRQPPSPSIPEINVKVSTANQMLLAHFVARVEAPAGPLRPYFDGLVGFKYIFTRSSVEDDGLVLASSTNFDDAASGLGSEAASSCPCELGTRRAVNATSSFT